MNVVPVPAIDFGAVPQKQVPAPQPKRTPHVYFGPKDPETGEMLPEPIYEHREFPKVLYTLEGGTVHGIQVDSQEEVDALPAGKYFYTPAVFGLVTAPTFEQSRQPQRLSMPDAEEVARGKRR
jgi:hypothetical protein